MKVFLTAIPDDEGLTVVFDQRDSTWDGLKGLAFHALPKGEVFLEKSGKDVFIRGNAEAVARLACSRCLEEFRYPLNITFRYTLRPLGKQLPRAKELELLPEDLEFGYYQDDTIELDRIIEEHLILSIPMKPLCKETCEGLCPQCGSNRNVAECQCPGRGLRSPFDSLKDIIN